MATPTRQFDPANIETQVFDIARALLDELGSSQTHASLRGSAYLDRDLGLGSLERVELLIRLRRAFGASLPERIVTEAATLDDVIAALSGAQGLLSAHEQISVPVQWRDSQSLTALSPLPQSGSSSATLSSAETWQEVIRYRAHADAERTHLIFWEEGLETHRITFGELHTGAQTVAIELGRRGIVRGDAVALMLPTGREFFLTYAGVLLAGGVPVPIYPPVRADRIAEYAQRQSAILRNADARLLVTFQEAARVAKLLQPSIKSLRGVVTAAELVAPDEPLAPGEHPKSIPASAGDLALLQYTSGSTGDPKGVMLTHSNLLANVRAIGAALAIRPDDVGISWLPLYHDMGLIGAWLMPLYFGLPVVVLSPIDFLTRPERWLWAFHRHRGTLTAAPNFAYELATRKVADSDIEGLNLSTVRAALNGAEPVNADTLDRFAARFASHGFRREALTPVYGLAESALAVTIPPMGRGPRVDRLVRETFTREGRAVAAASDAQADDPSVVSFVSVGHPLPNHEVSIVDSAGQEVAERVEGDLWFRGPSATSGYFRNPDATRKLFPDGQQTGSHNSDSHDSGGHDLPWRNSSWRNSGDRAYLAEGEVFITGRVKEIIFKAGRNLYPHEIEEVAGRVAGVRKGCVVAFGAADAATGTERLVVVAETRERDAVVRGRIVAAITEQVTTSIGLPPDLVKLLPPHCIPKTSSGKLRRDQTRRLYLAGTLGSAAPPPWLQVARLTIGSGAQATGRLLWRAFEALYGVYAAVVFGLWLVPTWLAVSIAPDRAAARITSLGLRGCLAMAGCRVRIEGSEHLATPAPRIIVSNHTSYFDVLVLMATLGMNYHFVAKSEVRTMPFIGTFLRKLGHFSFNRSNPRARLRQVEEIEEALQRGESVLVFPEGTFTAQVGVRPFHLGAFKAAAHAHCTILPVALQGTRRFLRDGSYLPRPSRITVTICPPIESQTESQTPEWQEVVRLRDAARQTISDNAGEPLL